MGVTLGGVDDIEYVEFEEGEEDEAEENVFEDY